MPAKKYRVDLTAHERETLLNLIRSGRTTARQVTRARILLKADEGLTDEEIAEEVATGRASALWKGASGPSRSGRGQVRRPG